jgi:hypothetical protein
VSANLSCSCCESLIDPSLNLTNQAVQVAEGIEQLDLLVKARRTKINQSKDIKSHVGQPHTRRLGEQKEKPLPYPGKGDPIHLDLVDQVWLSEHPESASRRMILHWTKEEVDDGELGDIEDDMIGDWEAAQDEGKDDYINPELRSSGSSFEEIDASDAEDWYADN